MQRITPVSGALKAIYHQDDDVLATHVNRISRLNGDMFREKPRTDPLAEVITLNIYKPLS